MYNKNNKKITFILYDSILNSVFTSQVLQPLLNKINKDKKLEITLISFEKKKPPIDRLKKLIPAHERLHLVLARKLPFFGKLSLLLACYQLKKLLKIIPHDEIITRGPLAGWVAIKTIGNKPKNKTKITIQARGLCAQEYRFSKNYFEKKEDKRIQKFIYKELNEIENKVFCHNKKEKFEKKIEAVSPALKEYLVANFGASEQNIKIASHDFPQNINEREKEKYRKVIREKLNIPTNNLVYCYSGSYKPWQCIPEIIDFFKKEHRENANSFLLLLSQDKEKLEKLLISKKIPEKNYKVLSVSPENLKKYLAASDVGVLFRNKDIINWVSRPTKMLEYQASGLRIVHNKTIAWLEN